MTPDRRPPSSEGPHPADPRPPADSSDAVSSAASGTTGAAVSSAAVSSAPAGPDNERSARLVSLIRAEIESSPSRRITFARFMERALYEPDLGYYRQAADRPTEAGDFLTAPETHAIFGWTVARRIEAMWAELGRPRPFHFIEYGAGSGTFAVSMLDGLRRRGSKDLLDAIRYEPIESNPRRLDDLRRRFERDGLAGRLAEIGAPTDGSVPVTGVILANEFLDALPVHRVVFRGGELLELFVVLRESAGGGFAEIAAEPSTPELAPRLADDGVDLAEGQVAEICLELDPWLRGVALRLARGYVLAIDYGYEAAELYGPRRLAGTLLGYRGHRVEENPFADPGLVDLTAHVDFTAVGRLAARHGLRTVSLATQSEFLVAAGLEEEWRAFQVSPGLTPAEYIRARSGIVRMLDPRHMGRFRVLVMARDAG
jgi:SAM-dependent MidA family methyltransferase